MNETKDIKGAAGLRVNSKVILMLSAFVFIFYFVTNVLAFNVYKYVVAGALFELLSIPMLFLLFILPVLCVVHLIQTRGKGLVYPVVSILFIMITIFILVK